MSSKGNQSRITVASKTVEPERNLNRKKKCPQGNQTNSACHPRPLTQKDTLPSPFRSSKPGMVAHTRKLSTWQVTTGKLQFRSQRKMQIKTLS